MYKPIETLRKIRSLMEDDGIVFIRCPDSEVSGIKRDFGNNHYLIHPLIWCEQAFYELLYQLKDCFQVYETYTLQPGQRDYLLKCISKKPTIGVGYIAKNEERDIPKSLSSVAPFADLICIRDTGSIDNTEKVVKKFAKEQSAKFTHGE